MIDRNKEALLEVRLNISNDRERHVDLFSYCFLTCAPFRNVSAAVRCPSLRLRESCGSKRTERSRGRSVTSSSGLRGSITSRRAKLRSGEAWSRCSLS